MSDTQHHQIVIVGGGTAGITVAAQLTRSWFHRRDVAVIEPSIHFLNHSGRPVPAIDRGEVISELL